MNISVKEAFDLLLENRTIMVSMDDDDLMECNLEYLLDTMAFDTLTNMVTLTDDQVAEVWEYLEEKEKLELWD